MAREISLIFYLYIAYFFPIISLRALSWINCIFAISFWGKIIRREETNGIIVFALLYRWDSPSKYTECRALLNELCFWRRSQISRRWWLIVNIILSWIECSYRSHVIVDFSPRQALRDEGESHYLPTISINIIPFNELCLMRKSFSVKSPNITRFLINVLIIIHLLLFERNISSSGTLESDR